ncbi:potassium channel family protein [Streptomyces sp. NPDC048258]|uniref:potassium channel family protein n=1 Tax=Streptomyces sp. NPDC048258 TaxID=3365527 RepID=UPI00371EFB41
MNWLFNVAGAALVLFVLRDVFHTLWHPTRHGGLSRLVMTSLWRLSSSLTPRRRASGLTGPLAMVAVVAVWALTVVVGWALIYWPHMPDAFTYTAGLRPAEHASFVDALYISLVNVSTLGLGDIAPTEGWLRIFAPLEALADQASVARHPDVRLSAAVLRAALEDLAAILDQRFLHTRGAACQVFEAFARDHGHHAGA